MVVENMAEANIESKTYNYIANIHKHSGACLQVEVDHSEAFFLKI